MNAVRIATVLAALVAVVAGTAAREAPRAQGAARLLELLGTRPGPCPVERPSDARCGRFGGTFGALKLDLELTLRRTDMTALRPDGAWQLSGGIYRRPMLYESRPFELVFDPDAGEVWLHGEAVERVEAEVAARERAATIAGRTGYPEYDLADGVVAPERIESSVVPPPVPTLAKIDRVGGRVVVEGVVGADGVAAGLAVTEAEPRGYGFEDAALETVEAWRFEPGTLDGRPVPVPFRVTVEFPH